MAEVHGNRTRPRRFIYKQNQYLMLSKKVKVKDGLKVLSCLVITIFFISVKECNDNTPIRDPYCIATKLSDWKKLLHLYVTFVLLLLFQCHHFLQSLYFLKPLHFQIEQ